MAIFEADSRHSDEVAHVGGEAWGRYAREMGHNLLRARHARGLSQEAVAHAAGIAGFTYQKFEKGESRPGSPMNPRLSTLLSLAQVLDVAVEDLLPEEAPDLTEGAAAGHD